MKRHILVALLFSIPTFTHADPHFTFTDVYCIVYTITIVPILFWVFNIINTIRLCQKKKVNKVWYFVVAGFNLFLALTGLLAVIRDSFDDPYIGYHNNYMSLLIVLFWVLIQLVVLVMGYRARLASLAT